MSGRVGCADCSTKLLSLKHSINRRPSNPQRLGNLRSAKTFLSHHGDFLNIDAGFSPSVDALGLRFVWDPLSAVWEEMHAALVTHRGKHDGDYNVPDSYAENHKLGTWVNNQRALCNSKKLKLDRIGRLEDIGFEWSRSGSVKGEEVYSAGKNE
jgi:hypothetical protein